MVTKKEMVLKNQTDKKNYTSSTEKRFEVKRSYAIYTLVLLCSAMAFDFADRQVIAAVLPLIKVDLGLSDMQLGSLSTVLTLMVGLCVIPAAIMVDRWSRRKMIGLMVFSWSLASGAAFFTRSFNQLFVTRLFVGIGEAGYGPGGVALLSSMWPEKIRARVMGIFNTNAIVGTLLGLLVGGYIGSKYGWHSAFGILAIPGIMVSILCWFLRDYKSFSIGANGLTHYAKAYAAAFRIPSLVFAYAGMTLATFINYSMLYWLPTLMVRCRGLDISEASQKTAPVFVVAVIGGISAGFIADWLDRQYPKGKMYLSSLLLMLYTVFVGSGFYLVENQGGYVLLILGGLFSTSYVTVTISITQDVIHPAFRALSWGLSLAFMNVVGSISPMITGFLSDFIGLKWALLSMCSCGLMGALAFLYGASYFPSDREKVTKIEIESEKRRIDHD